MNFPKAKLAILISALCSPPLLAKPNILLIGTDGAAARYIEAGIRQTKPDSAIPGNSNEARPLPTFQSMMRDMRGGLSTNMTATRAQNGRYNTISGANWTSLLTGREYDVHGVRNNTIVNTSRDGQTAQEFANYQGTPVLTQELRRLGYKTKMMVEWNEINLAYGRFFNEAERVPLVWRDRLPDGSRGPLTPVTENNYRVGEALRQTDANFMFVHIDNVDYEGHTYRWDSPNYAIGMQQLDDKIKLILNGLMARANINQEEWIIGITPDHGGVNFGHGDAQNPLVYKTYFLALHWNKGQWRHVRMRRDGGTIADILPRLMMAKEEIRFNSDVNIQVGQNDFAALSEKDSWSIERVISQYALKKSGPGTLVVSEDSRFDRLEHQEGLTVLNADHVFDNGVKITGGALHNMGKLTASEIDNASWLINNGTIRGNVTLQDGALMSGNGTLLGNLLINSGASIAPGNSIGTTIVSGNVTFAPGSIYEVEVTRNGSSDEIISDSAININGGTVKLALDASATNQNLLAQDAVTGLVGQRYRILHADAGINGSFSAVDNTLFLGASLAASSNDMSMQLTRNGTTFSSIAETPNQQAVAVVAESLGAGNPVYESLLMLNSTDIVRSALEQLDGQIYADMASTHINDSRYMRNTINNRLRQAEELSASPDIKPGSDHRFWGQFIGGWGNASQNGNASGYRNSASGMQFGFDTDAFNAWRLGVATGFTRTSLNSDGNANASSDNYHLGLYAGKRFGPVALRTGGTYTWHHITAARSINYDAQSNAHTSRYGARTGQVFVEGAYPLSSNAMNLEPFANLAHIRHQNNGLQENSSGGGASALRANKQQIHSTPLTLGLRASSRWEIARNTDMAVHAELGWVHHLGNTSRDSSLMFKDSNQPFVVNSVAAARNGGVLKTQADVAMGRNAMLSFGYSGQLSSSHRDHAVDAKLNWRF